MQATPSAAARPPFNEGVSDSSPQELEFCNTALRTYSTCAHMHMQLLYSASLLNSSPDPVIRDYHHSWVAPMLSLKPFTKL